MKFTKVIQEVQQKSGFKNLLLECKLSALNDTLKKKEAQLSEVLSASNLDPSTLNMVTHKLEVHFCAYIVTYKHLQRTYIIIYDIIRNIKVSFTEVFVNVSLQL